VNPDGRASESINMKQQTNKEAIKEVKKAIKLAEREIEEWSNFLKTSERRLTRLLKKYEKEKNK
jgi:hypothetical protein